MMASPNILSLAGASEVTQGHDGQAIIAGPALCYSRRRDPHSSTALATCLQMVARSASSAARP